MASCLSPLSKSLSFPLSLSLYFFRVRFCNEMGFDAMANEAPGVPSAAREFGKKKRVNRSAKLKQCKLDARREQWLSQVKNKEFKDTSMGTSLTSPLQPISEGRSEEREKRHQAAPADLEHDGSTLHDNSDAESPTHHPTAKPSRKEFLNCNSSGSSGSNSTGSCSRSVSDADDDNNEETGEKDGGSIDDWEAMADAISVSPDNGQGHHLKADDSQITTVTTKSVEPLKLELERIIPRAWRPDDAFRPQSLPNLSKQRSFSANNHRCILSCPQCSCPICYEDLDVTDSSFLPCSCGFHLCLFCHKRILEGDGRCPGCRKQYSTTAGDEEDSTSVSEVLKIELHVLDCSWEDSRRNSSMRIIVVSYAYFLFVNGQKFILFLAILFSPKFHASSCT